jgi:hypothetical protein
VVAPRLIATRNAPQVIVVVVKTLLLLVCVDEVVVDSLMVVDDVFVSWSMEEKWCHCSYLAQVSIKWLGCSLIPNRWGIIIMKWTIYPTQKVRILFAGACSLEAHFRPQKNKKTD